MARPVEPGTPVKPPKKGGGGGGSKPPKGSGSPPPASTPSWADYMALIQNDPIYNQAVADNKAAGVADESQLGSGILSALVNRGLVPNLDAAASALGLSPDVVNWIKSNVNLGQAQNLANQGDAAGTSLEAQLNQAHKTNLGNITDSLAARGMLRSGATTFLDGQEATRDTSARYQADKALADYINGAYSSFLGRQQGRTGDLRSALTDAYTRVLASLGGAAPPSGTQKPVDTGFGPPSASKLYASGAYRHIGPAITAGVTRGVSTL